MSAEMHATLRHYGTLIAAFAFATLALFAVLKHIAPPPAPVHAPVAVFSPSPVERETQALIDALQTVAQSKGGTSVLTQPAVAVIRDSGMVKGLSDAQIAQILGALKAKTVEKVAVGTQVVPPTPVPYTDTNSPVYQAAYAADVNALNSTKIKTDVTISQQEVSPSRIGSIISSAGSGVTFAVMRKKQYEFDLGIVEPNNANHIAGTAAIVYNLPHTSLGIGPSVVYSNGFRYGISAIIHF